MSTPKIKYLYLDNEIIKDCKPNTMTVLRSIHNIGSIDY